MAEKHKGNIDERQVKRQTRCSSRALFSWKRFLTGAAPISGQSALSSACAGLTLWVLGWSGLAQFPFLDLLFSGRVTGTYH